MTLELVYKDIKQTATIKGPSKEDDLFLELSNYIIKFPVFSKKKWIYSTYQETMAHTQKTKQSKTK